MRLRCYQTLLTLFFVVLVGRQRLISLIKSAFSRLTKLIQRRFQMLVSIESALCQRPSNYNFYHGPNYFYAIRHAIRRVSHVVSDEQAFVTLADISAQHRFG